MRGFYILELPDQRMVAKVNPTVWLCRATIPAQYTGMAFLMIIMVMLAMPERSLRSLIYRLPCDRKPIRGGEKIKEI